LKKDPQNKQLPLELAEAMKSLGVIKKKIADLEAAVSGGAQSAGGRSALASYLPQTFLQLTLSLSLSLSRGVRSVLVSLKDARAAVDKDPLRGVAMYKRASEWELQVCIVNINDSVNILLIVGCFSALLRQNQLTFIDEWEAPVMSTLDTTAPKLAEFLDWFELGVRDDSPGDIVYHKSLWQEVESGVWQVGRSLVVRLCDQLCLALTTTIVHIYIYIYIYIVYSFVGERRWMWHSSIAQRC
jgi:hypothetical protein